MSGSEAGWKAAAQQVTVRCRGQFGDDLVAVWVHGSAALAGWAPVSDLDVLVVVRDHVADAAALGSELLELDLAMPLELSVIGESLARRPAPPWPYLLHVNSADRVAGGDSGAGDPDLGMHLVVCHAAGLTMHGETPTLIGPIERGWVLRYLSDELQWGLAHADARYAVLNACRARAFAEQGLVLSKLAGAAWFTERHGRSSVVAQAVNAQRVGADLGPASSAAKRFVLDQWELLSAR